MYHPLLIFDGDTGELITLVLRPGNYHASRGVVSILRRLMERFQKKFGKKSKVLVRADAGFSIPALYRFCESGGLEYVIGMITNVRLKVLAEPLMETARRKYAKTGLKQRIFTEVVYKADSWDAPRRVIVKAECHEKGINRRFVVTNILGDPEELYDFYSMRGDCENRIKELKNGLKADRLSCHNFIANSFRLLLHAGAYVLMHALRQYLKGTELEKAQVETIRVKLIKIGVRIKQTCRRIKINFCSSYPYQDIFWKLFGDLMLPG